MRDLDGILSLANSDYSLEFAYDEMFDDLQKATAENHRFALFAVRGNEYVKYNVVFTTLPVVSVDGSVIGTNEDNREVFCGDMTVWEPVDRFSHSVRTQQSKVEYHFRGGTTYFEDKKSFKLSLKDADNSNRNLEFCSLGSDDDWILNSMTYDDTKLKEKISMDLWNEMSAATDHNYSMSTGSYAEVVVNGVYEGLYLLQRRVDPKYLSLSDSDILLKGKPTYHPQTVSDGYEIKYSPFSEEETYKIAEDTLINGDFSVYNTDNIVDIHLFLELGAMSDNASYKNMYYLLKYKDGGYQVHIVPWDTDMSFGIMWGNDFEVLTQKAIRYTVMRDEVEEKLLVQNPTAENLISDRWKQLRKDVFSAENISLHTDRNYALLSASGAYIRNAEVEPLRYGGEDTIENMKYFIAGKLKVMDEKYL